MYLSRSIVALRSSRSLSNAIYVATLSFRAEGEKSPVCMWLKTHLSLLPDCLVLVISTQSGEIFPSYVAQNARSLTSFEMTNQSDDKFSHGLPRRVQCFCLKRIS
jgi:hypothetical protein